MTTHKVSKKITSYRVVKDEQPIADTIEHKITIDETHVRPDMLFGCTYKIKTPVTEHAFYITINDVILNKYTDNEIRLPYEIFINTKNMEQFQWIIGMTRMISGIFRNGGNIIFIIEELKSVYDPKGGYFKKGGLYMNSLVAEIGYVIEQHLKYIGVIKTEITDEPQEHNLEEM